METRTWRHFDLIVMLTTLALAIWGVAMIYSATLGTEGNTGIESRVFRQLTFLALGLVLLGFLATTDYHILSNVAWAIYGACIGLLVVVLVIGRVMHGAQRWIPLGFFDLQPSEPAKLAVVIVLAKYLTSHRDQVRSVRVVMVSLCLALVPAALTLAQPDLGTSLVFVAIWLGIVLVAGMRWLHAAVLAALVIAATPLAWLLMHDYMRKRLLVFVDPSQDELGAGYNVIQALISVGSGGFFGRGFTSGTQSQLRFLRVQYADFIFSVLAEELGFLGAVLLLGLFAILLLRGLRAAAASWDTFGRLLCVGVVSALTFQIFVNVGMNIGLLPVAGVPLPLISYGGSSTFTVLAEVGVIQSVAMRQKRFEF